MVSNQLISTGAFEVYFDGQLVSGWVGPRGGGGDVTRGGGGGLCDWFEPRAVVGNMVSKHSILTGASEAYYGG
jgi:hypothetical protein